MADPADDRSTFSRSTVSLVQQLNSGSSFFMPSAASSSFRVAAAAAQRPRSRSHFYAGGDTGLKSNELYQTASSLSFSPAHLEGFPLEMLPCHMEIQRAKSNDFTDSFCGLSYRDTRMGVAELRAKRVRRLRKKQEQVDAVQQSLATDIARMEEMKRLKRQRAAERAERRRITSLHRCALVIQGRVRLVLALKATDAQRRKRQEHHCAQRIQRWLYKVVAILKHRSMLTRREQRRQRQEEKEQRREEKKKRVSEAAQEDRADEGDVDDEEESDGDEDAYAWEIEAEEEENTFLTRFMQRSGSIGEKIMMMRTLSPMSGKDGGSKGLGIVAELDEDGHKRDGASDGSNPDERIEGVDHITKVQARWHRATQRHPTSIQKVLRGYMARKKLRAHARSVGALHGMMTAHIKSFDGELDKTWTAQEASEEKPLYRRRNRFEALHDGGTASAGEGPFGTGGGADSAGDGTGSRAGGSSTGRRRWGPTPEEAAAAATTISAHYRRHHARGSLRQRREARAKEKAAEATRGAKAMMARIPQCAPDGSDVSFWLSEDLGKIEGFGERNRRQVARRKQPVGPLDLSRIERHPRFLGQGRHGAFDPATQPRHTGTKHNATRSAAVRGSSVSGALSGQGLGTMYYTRKSSTGLL